MYSRCVYCYEVIQTDLNGVWETKGHDNFCENNDFYNNHEPNGTILELYTNGV